MPLLGRGQRISFATVTQELLVELHFLALHKLVIRIKGPTPAETANAPGTGT